jgi:ABC-type sugar transport system ATPase subunit
MIEFAADAQPSLRSPAWLRIENLSKTFPGQRALNGVDMDFARGEVHALLGPNGSGKSTLIKVLAGYFSPDAGARLTIKGRPATFGRTLRTVDGSDTVIVRAVHQDMGLVGGLNAVDNIALGAGYLTSGGRVRWGSQAELTEELLAQVGGERINIRRPLDQCEPLERTQVAIARVLASWGTTEGLLILDEPTAALSVSQSDRLFQIVEDLRASGLSILYVSHRFREIFRLADRVTILREGARVATLAAAELDHNALVQLVTGPSSAPPASRTVQPSKRGTRDTTPVLEVSDLVSRELRGISFGICSGEILGFAGLVGSGQEELPYLLVGARRANAGTLRVGDITVPLPRMTPHRAVDIGIGLVPADRAREAVVSQFSVLHNLTLPGLPRFQRQGRLRRTTERVYGWTKVDDFDIRPRDLDRRVLVMSGGNAQKVVLAKWLGISTRAILLAEPTAGVDIGTRPTIYQALREHADAGLAVIVSSTDVTELVELCTRVIVLREGQIVDEMQDGEITESRILQASLAAHHG